MPQVSQQPFSYHCHDWLYIYIHTHTQYCHNWLHQRSPNSLLPTTAINGYATGFPTAFLLPLPPTYIYIYTHTHTLLPQLVTPQVSQQPSSYIYTHTLLPQLVMPQVSQQPSSNYCHKWLCHRSPSSLPPTIVVIGYIYYCHRSPNSLLPTTATNGYATGLPTAFFQLLP